MLTKTNIEYGEKNWNFYPGCLHWKNPEICPVGEKCWAKTTTEGRMQESFEPHLIPENLLDPLRRKKPTRILVNFRGDLMGGWVDPEQKVLEYFKPVKVGGRSIQEFDGTLRSGVIDVMKLSP